MGDEIPESEKGSWIDRIADGLDRGTYTSRDVERLLGLPEGTLGPADKKYSTEIGEYPK